MIKKCVFASKAEQKNYYKLMRVWGHKYHLHHNLPFLNLFDLREELKQKQVSKEDFNRLKKTSVDFTLCTEDDAPLCSIEFDGWSEGFNVGARYEPGRELDDPSRQVFLELKLSVAHAHGYSFLVVGSKYFQDVTETLKLTIVDGVIGTLLTARACSNRFSKGFDPEEVGLTQEEFDNLPPPKRGEIVQDWVLSVEVDEEMENNPLEQALANLRFGSDRLMSEVTGEGHGGILYRPDIDVDKPPLERWQDIKNASFVGCSHTLKTKDFGEIQETIWMPNFNIPGAYLTYLSQQVAELITWDRLRILKKNTCA